MSKKTMRQDLRLLRAEVGEDGNLNYAEPNLWRIDWKKSGFDFCCVYVIGPDKKWPMKIGISTSPAKRLNAMQTALWDPLVVHKLYFANSSAEAREVEQAAHQWLREKGKALLGEWFDARPDDAAAAVEFAALMTGIEISKEPPCGIGHDVVQDMMQRVYERVQKARLSTYEATRTSLWSYGV